MPKPLTPVDIVRSYARPLGEQVKIVLFLPARLALDDTEPVLRLRRVDVTDHSDDGGDESGVLKVRVRPERTDAGWRVEALLAASALGPGLWRLRLAGVGQLLRLQAWLMLSDTAPLALLPGPRPATALPEPRPRSSSRS